MTLFGIIFSIDFLYNYFIFILEHEYVLLFLVLIFYTTILYLY